MRILALVAGLVAVLLFSVQDAHASPSISMSTNQAAPGAIIKISGTGFSSSDTSVTVTNLQGLEQVTYTPVTGTNCKPSDDGFTPPAGTFVCPSEGVQQTGCPISGGSFSCYFMVASVSSGVACDPGSTCAGNQLGSLEATGSSGDFAEQRASIVKGMSLVPNEGNEGTRVSLYGTGWLGTVVVKFFPITDVATDLYIDDKFIYEAVVLGIGGEPTSCLTAPTGQLTDNGPCTINYADTAQGIHTVTAKSTITGDVPDKSYSASFLVPSPTISLSTSSDTPGSSVTVTGLDFVGSTDVTISFNSDVVGSCPISGSTFSCSFTVPFLSGGSQIVTVNGNAGFESASVPFTIGAGITVSPASTFVGQQLSVVGRGFLDTDTSYSLTFGSMTIPVTCVPNASTVPICSSVVPSVLPGTYTVTLTGNSGDSSSQTIAVHRLTQISLSTTRGAAGTSVVVNGVGFSPSSTSVDLTFFSPTPIDITPPSGCPITPTSPELGGTISCAFTVPNVPVSTGFVYELSATDNSEDDALALFSVTLPGLHLFPSAGSPGSTVNVFGTGFSLSDNAVTLQFGNTDVTQASGCPVSGGDISCSFVVPNMPAGSYIVTAKGNSGDTLTETFTIGSGMSSSPSSGSPGDSITVDGGGFSSSDTSVKLQFSGNEEQIDITPASGCPVTEGSFSCTVMIPQSAIPVSLPKGSYDITGTGNSGDIQTTTFDIIPTISLSPASGPAGTIVHVTGAGFAQTSNTIVYEMIGAPIPNNFCSVSFGFGTLSSCSFTIPSTSPGHYSFVATGNNLENATAEFTVTTPSLSASPSSGSAGAQVVVSGSSFPPSGTSVTLQFDSADVTPTSGCPVSNGIFACPFTIPSVSLGTHSITANDNNGVKISASFDVIDTVPPTLDISFPNNNTVTSSTAPTVSGTASDDASISSVTWKVDDGAVSTASGTASWSFVPSLRGGPNLIQINATDASGLVTSQVLQITLDSIPPTLSVVSPTNNAILNHISAVNGTATDDTSISLITAKVDNGPVFNVSSGDNYVHWSSNTEALSDGTHTVYINATDLAGLVTSQSVSFLFDNISPTTSVLLSGIKGTNEWYTSSVQVTLHAIDDPKGSGVKTTAYSLDGSPPTIYTAPFNVTSDGNHILTFNSTDNAGNMEAEKTMAIKIDTSPPIVTGSVNMTENSMGWYNHPLQVSWTGTEETSGIKSCDSPTIYTGPDGSAVSIVGHCIDNAGNVGTSNVTIKYDAAPPIIVVPPSITSVFPTSQAGSVVTFSDTNGTAASATDATSGVESITYSPSSGSTFPTGTTAVTVTATDNAGNADTGTFTVTVLSPAEAIQYLAHDINSVNLDHGFANSLDQKLAAATSSLNSGNDKEAKNQLNAFINEVSAQAGKKLTQDQANQLISVAQNIINSIS